MLHTHKNSSVAKAMYCEDFYMHVISKIGPNSPIISKSKEFYLKKKERHFIAF